MSSDRATLEKILDLARWAPSGDNTQPWRFEICADDAIAVHGFDTREHCVYDFDGRPSQLSLGALLQTIEIAATIYGIRASIARRTTSTETRPVFDVQFCSDPAVGRSELADCIRLRSVQRRPLKTTPLDEQTKAHLAASTGAGYEIRWFESMAQRLNVAQLLFAGGRIRLTMPEAYEVHRSVIEFGARYSDDRIPDQAVGLDPLTTRLMRWTMASWERVQFFNTYLAGTLIPRVQLDFVPAIACAAHFAILAPTPPRTIDDYIDAGRAMQRLWLSATAHGLQLQPEMTPLIFSWYVRAGRRFSRVPELWNSARRLTARLSDLLGDSSLKRCVFFGRIGHGPAANARSLRRPLHSLMPRSGEEGTQR